MTRNNNEIKNGGIYYTPAELANFAAELVIKKPESTLLDPCFGHGSLLLSAYDKLVKLGCKNPKEQLYGCDILQPPPKVSMSLQKIVEEGHLIEEDFFNVEDKKLKKKFDIILMNPPFVRHHLIAEQTKSQLKEAIGNTLNISKTSDLWGYFVIHSLAYLKEEGSMLAILPWSFLYSDYSNPIRQHLMNNFGSIKTILVGKRLFHNTQERILLLLAEDYGGKSIEISCSFSNDIPEKDINWASVDIKELSKYPDDSFFLIKEDEYLNGIAKRINFQPLGDFGDIRIGTVTGANDFFIVNGERAIELEIPEDWLNPIIAKAVDINKFYIINRSDTRDFVLTIPNNQVLPPNMQSYIDDAEEKGYKERYHCRKRAKWYSIELKDPPDAFLPYMIKEIPMIILNPGKIWSTNNIHGVYFNNDCTEDTVKWIQLSMLSSLSQLSIEVFSRTYGSGVLKIEPSEAKKILVFPGNGYNYPIGVENTVQNLIQEGNRKQAKRIVDSWFMDNLNISKDEMDTIIGYYEKLKNIRLGCYQIQASER